MIAQDLLDRARDTRDRLAEQIIAERRTARNQYAVAAIIFAMITAVAYWGDYALAFWIGLPATIVLAALSLYAESLRYGIARAYSPCPNCGGNGLLGGKVTMTACTRCGGSGRRGTR